MLRLSNLVIALSNLAISSPLRRSPKRLCPLIIGTLIRRAREKRNVLRKLISSLTARALSLDLKQFSIQVLRVGSLPGTVSEVQKELLCCAACRTP